MRAELGRADLGRAHFERHPPARAGPTGSDGEFPPQDPHEPDSTLTCELDGLRCTAPVGTVGPDGEAGLDALEVDRPGRLAGVLRPGGHVPVLPALYAHVRPSSETLAHAPAGRRGRRRRSATAGWLRRCPVASGRQEGRSSGISRRALPIALARPVPTGRSLVYASVRAH